MGLNDGTRLELRVAVVPLAGRGNEGVVLRILAPGKPIRLESLQMSEANLAAFQRMIRQPYGLLLCVGPTGSGKTTTLHAALGDINDGDIKIWTAENPVEITQDGLCQVQVEPRIGFDFARAMRAFLRADPDVIMVGEMRDVETASVALEASLTGHRVLSTLHTNTAPETITRLLDLGLDPLSFADSLIGVLAQRLVPTLCTSCRRETTLDQKQRDDLVHVYGVGASQADGLRLSPGTTVYRAVGCVRCDGTGYRGRMGLHELLDATDDIQRLIREGRPVGDIRQTAQAAGMRTLLQDGVRKVLAGHTDMRQVLAVCRR